MDFRDRESVRTGDTSKSSINVRTQGKANSEFMIGFSSTRAWKHKIRDSAACPRYRTAFSENNGLTRNVEGQQTNLLEEEGSEIHVIGVRGGALLVQKS